MKILILGATGMLGFTLLRRLPELTGHEVWGTVRRSAPYLAVHQSRLIEGIDADCLSTIQSAIEQLQPDVVLNCIGLIKQLKDAKNPIPSLRINALLPHELAQICRAQACRMVHFSTDCVFSGTSGNYTEHSYVDPIDLYGRTKHLGEVSAPGVLTLRTSIIGHEPGERHASLIDWFMHSTGTVKGYRKAMYSGVPTIVMARFIASHVLPNPQLHGLWHMASSTPTDKFSLLKLVQQRYGKTDVSIVPDDNFTMDRSMSAQRLRATTGYESPSWPAMIEDMYHDYLDGGYVG